MFGGVINGLLGLWAPNKGEKKFARAIATAIDSEPKVLSAPSYANDVVTPKKRGGRLFVWFLLLLTVS
jgi:hypothetical protein